MFSFIAEIAEERESDMISCPNCGHFSNGNYCSWCGTKLKGELLWVKRLKTKK